VDWLDSCVDLFDEDLPLLPISNNKKERTGPGILLRSTIQ